MTSKTLNDLLVESEDIAAEENDENGGSNQNGRSEIGLILDFPCWECVVQHLSFQDLLCLRLVCRGWLNGLKEQLGASVLANLALSPALRKRRVYLLGNAHIDKYWRLATNQGIRKMTTLNTTKYTFSDGSRSRWKQQVEEEEEDENLGKGGVLTLARALRFQSKFPMDLLLQIFHILKYMPIEAAVGFSGKYGRQVIPLSLAKISEANDRAKAPPNQPITLQPIYHFERCNRNPGKKCPSCKCTIPKLATTTQQQQQDEDVLHQNFAIEARDGGGKAKFLDLSECHPICFPNLPQFLTCPYCKGVDNNNQQRQTLVMSDLSYSSERGTEKERTHEMTLTFTPEDENNHGMDDSDDDDQNEFSGLFPNMPSKPSKRAKIERRYRRPLQQNTAPPTKSCPTEDKRFPPRYREMCVPGFQQYHSPNVKYGLTIYCTACREFALVAPAGLCHSDSVHHDERILSFLNHGDPCHEEDSMVDEEDDLDNQDCSEDAMEGEPPLYQLPEQWTLPPPRPSVEPPFIMGGMFVRQLCPSCKKCTIPCSICRHQRRESFQNYTSSNHNNNCVTCASLA